MGTLIYLFLFLILFRFIMRYVLPIFHITRAAGDRMREMQDQMRQMNGNNTPPPAPGRPSRSKKGDYIDFEEIK